MLLIIVSKKERKKNSEHISKMHLRSNEKCENECFWRWISEFWKKNNNWLQRYYRIFKVKSTIKKLSILNVPIRRSVIKWNIHKDINKALPQHLLLFEGETLVHILTCLLCFSTLFQTIYLELISIFYITQVYFLEGKRK